MSDRAGRIVELFEAALEVSASEREAFVREECGDDAELCAQVLELLAADARAGAFLDEPAISPAVAGSIADEALSDPELDSGEGPAQGGDTGRVIGRYRLLELIGRGGMGSVYLAEHAEEDLGLRVAVKLIRRGMDTEDLLRRFHRERRLLARLEHPNIGRLLDGGADEHGRPYLVVEYVQGVPIDKYCRQERLDVRTRIDLFLEVCAAVQHAHRNLTVHRDLKPPNILVTSGGTVKLLDFGIAKMLSPEADELTLTAPAQRLYSPRYASPEQIRGLPVTTSSDVYALGVILYELLTGVRPFGDDSTTVEDLERRVVRDEATPPSSACETADPDARPGNLEIRVLKRSLRGDLDTIVLKALQKEPERRYVSVDELADDLRRHLDGRPVLARPDSVAYRTRKLLRRHLAATAAIGFVALAMIAATAVSITFYLGAEREREAAQEVSGFLEDMLGSIDPAVARGGDAVLMRDLLARAAERVDNDLVERPQVASPLHLTIGRTYKSLGDFERAERHLVRSRELGFTGDARSRLELGSLYVLTDRFEEALRDLEVTIDLARAEGDSLSLAQAQFWIGQTYEKTGEYDLALSTLVEAERILRENGADRERIQVLNGLGGFILNNRHEYATADSIYAIALELVEELDAGPLAVGVELQHIATAKRRLGLSAQADSLYSVALIEYEKVLEPDHPQIASLRDEWATLLEREQRFEEAEHQYSEAHRAAVAAYGPRHSLVGTISNNYANLLRKTGRHGEAAILYEQALDCYRENLGAEHAWVGILLGNIVSNELASGDAAEALEQADECLRIRGLHWQPEHWRIASVEMLRGAALMDLERFGEAEVTLIDSGEKLDEELGPESEMARQCDSYLEELYERWRPAPAATRD